MKVIYQDGEYSGKPKVPSMGYLVPVPKGYEPIVKRGTMWDDAVRAGAVKRLDGSEWETEESGGYSVHWAYCINVDKLKDWYRKQIAIREAEVEQYVKALKLLEGE